MNEHRVPMLGGAWRRHGDPAHSSDPRVRELVGALAGLDVAPPMRAEFRAELRAQLVAVTPRLVEEGEPSAAAPVEVRGKRAAKAERAAAESQRRFRFAKPLIAAACALTAFILLLGGAVLLSQHALPGDALYGVKRASENAEYSITGGTVAKGKLKLDFAATRIGEVTDLLHAPTAMAGGAGAIADSGQISSSTAGLVSDTLASADSDVLSASTMLNGEAVRNNDAGSLTAITSWTPAQVTAMRNIVGRIPAGSKLHQDAVDTLALLRQAHQRSAALRADLGCNCLSSTDNLGPVPCTGSCSPTQGPGGSPATKTPGPTSPRSPSSVGTGHRVSTTPPVGVPVSTGPGTGTGTGTNPTPTGGGTGHTPAPGPSIVPTKTPLGGPSSPHLPIPSLPGVGGHSGTGSGQTGTKLPIKVTTTCVSAGVGGVGVGVGNC